MGCVLVGAAVAVVAFIGLGAGAQRLSTSQARSAYGRLPLSFEQNRGQAPSSLAFIARGNGYALGLGRDGIALSLAHGRTGAQLRVSAPGGQLAAPVAQQPLRGRVNYLMGRDSSRWLRNLSTFGRVVYRNVWPGVDLAFHGRQGVLEYDLGLAPNADPARVALQFAGARWLRPDGAGGALIGLAGGTVRIPAPHSYQGSRTITSRLVVNRNTLRIALGSYDRSQPLIVDPSLVYSTYLGGSNEDGANGIAVDSSGDAYVTGTTFSTDFPTTTGAAQGTFGGGFKDAFVTKLNAAGTALVYSTYLGGSSDDEGAAVAVDSSGDAYVAGATSSSNFPVTTGAFQTTYGGATANVFVAKLNAAGTGLDYSTFIGGSGAPDSGQGIAVDSSGDAYVTGFSESSGFPVTTGAFQTTSGGQPTAFVTKLNAAGTHLVYSTFIGGSGGDSGNGIAIDASGDAYVIGNTSSTNFPTTTGAFQTALAGGQDAFVTKLNAAGSHLVYSTYLGGSAVEQGNGIAVDTSGDVYVIGTTRSADFPTTSGAFQTALDDNQDAFVTKLNATGTALAYSTLLGGNSSDQGAGIAVDSSGDAYVTGLTASSDFPTTPGAFQTSSGGGIVAFVTVLNPVGTQPLYSTYLGGTGQDEGSGIAVDTAGNAYITGGTESKNFPTTSGAYKTTLGGTDDAFIAKFNPVTVSIAGTTVNEPATARATTTATFTVTLPKASTSTVTVDFHTSDGSAQAPQDYLPASGTLTFTPGQTTKTINVTVNGDGVNEPFEPRDSGHPTEQFTVTLSNPSGGTIGTGTATGTILASGR